VVPENIHTHPKEGCGNSSGEGVSKATIFKGKYEPKLEFPERWGAAFNKFWDRIKVFSKP